MRLHSIACAAALFALIPSHVRAQGAAPPPPPPTREGSAEFAYVGTSGNASTRTLGLGGELILRPPSWVVRDKLTFVRNENTGELKAESFADLFRVERIVNPRLSAFGQYGYLHDRFAGVEHRNGLLGGLAYKLVNAPQHLLVVDAGFGYLNEQRTVGEDVSSGTFGAGAGYKWKLSDTASFSDDFAYTGIFSDSSDWRLDQQAALVARITQLFSLKVSNTVRYSNLPPVGFKSTDTVTAVAIVAKF